MNNEIRNQVIERLKSYPALIQKRNILRYELEHPTVVSDEEMLEAMNYLKGSGGIPHGGVSNKTLYIALNYHEAAASLNAEARNDLLKRLLPLENEIAKLEYYLKMLTKREQSIIRKCFFEGKQQQDVAEELGVTAWTVRRYRDQAVDKLTEMYAFAEGKI